MGFWSNLGKLALNVGPAIATGGASLPATLAATAGAGISAMSGAAASNRGANVEADLLQEDRRQGREGLRQGQDQNQIAAGRLNADQTRDFHDASLAREVEGREGRRSAFSDLQRAEYVAGNTGYTPQNGLKSYGFGPKASTEGERVGAEAMKAEVMARLQGGNSLPTVERPTNMTLAQGPRIWDEQFEIDPKYRKPGIWERIGGVLGPVLTAAGSRQSDGGASGNYPRTPGFGE